MSLQKRICPMSTMQQRFCSWKRRRSWLLYYILLLLLWGWVLFFYLFRIWPDTHTPKHMMMLQQQPKKSWEGGAGRSVGCCYAGSLLFSQVGRTEKCWYARSLLMLLFLNKQQCCFVWQVAELRYDSQMITHLTSITTLLKNSKCMLKLIVHFLLGHFPSKILL